MGDATEDEDLRRPGSSVRADIVAASDGDADNLYIALSARAVRPDIPIVARGSDTDAEKKLMLAGADRVVMPYTAAGRTMANLVLKPQVTAFLDAVTTADGPDLHMAEIEVRRDVRERRARRSATSACGTSPARSSSRCASATARSTRRPSPTP